MGMSVAEHSDTTTLPCPTLRNRGWESGPGGARTGLVGAHRSALPHQATDKKGSRHALRVAHFCPGVLHTALA